MDPKVQIVLIIALAVVVVLIVFRRRLSKFIFKADSKGINAELNAMPPAAIGQGKQEGIIISENKQIGRDNKIRVSKTDAVQITDNKQKGDGQEIDVSGK